MTEKDVYFYLDNERRKRGITIKELTARCGISERTWNGYKAKPERMTIGTIFKIERFMMLDKGRRLL